MALLEVRDLSKAYGARRALDRVSFDLAEGEAASLVGANGAGKTTLLRAVAGLVRPAAGTVCLDGQDMAAMRRAVGYVAHDTMLYEDLSAEANLRLYACLYDVLDGERRTGELLARVGLAERRHERVRTYSHGLRQRLALARALLHRPRLLLLDEPASGLDAAATALLNAMVAEQVAGGCAVLLATHDPGRTPAIGERVLALAGGRLVADAPRDEVAPERLAALCRGVSGATGRWP